MPHTLASLATAYRAVKAHSAHRDMGKRALRDAKALGDRNPERVAELLAKAAMLLPYAEAAG